MQILQKIYFYLVVAIDLNKLYFKTNFELVFAKQNFSV